MSVTQITTYHRDKLVFSVVLAVSGSFSLYIMIRYRFVCLNLTRKWPVTLVASHVTTSYHSLKSILDCKVGKVATHLSQIARYPTEHSCNHCILTSREGHTGLYDRWGLWQHHGSLCLRSHIRVTICAASASQGVGGLGQMGERVVSSGLAVARRASGQPLCN